MNHLSRIRQPPAASAPVIPLAADKMRRVIVAGLLVTTAMVALLAASQLINYGVFDLRLRAFDTDTHASVFGVASILAEAAAGAAIAWRGSRVERHRWAWLALAALVAGLIVMRTMTTFNAATLAAPLACVFVLVCWLTWPDPVAPRTVVWAALILMVTSLVLHQVGLDADVLNYSNQSWAYQITAVAKHGCELAGWLLLATGIIAAIEGRPAREVTPAGIVAPEMELGRALTNAFARGLVRRARPWRRRQLETMTSPSIARIRSGPS